MPKVRLFRWEKPYPFRVESAGKANSPCPAALERPSSLADVMRAPPPVSSCIEGLADLAPLTHKFLLPSIFFCSVTWQRRGHFSVPVKFQQALVVISPKGIGKRRCCPKLSAAIYSTYNHSIPIFDFGFMALSFLFLFSNSKMTITRLPSIGNLTIWRCQFYC